MRSRWRRRPSASQAADPAHRAARGSGHPRPDPGRTFVGRIVFAALCDKLFDINAKLKIVPAARHRLRVGDRRQDADRSSCGRACASTTASRMDAEAVQVQLDRHLTMQGSLPPRRDRRRSRASRWSTDDRAHPARGSRSRRFLAQLTDRAGMMVSPKAAEAAGRQFRHRAGLRRPLPLRRARGAGPHRGRALPDYWDAARIHIDRIVFLPIPDNTVRLANLHSGAARDDASASSRPT